MFQIWQQGGLILHSKINVLTSTQIVNTSREQFQMQSFDWEKCGNLFFIACHFLNV